MVFEIIEDFFSDKPRVHWILDSDVLNPTEKLALKGAASTWGGDIDATSAYFLNSWVKTPDGLKWLLNQSLPLSDSQQSEAEGVLKMCLDASAVSVRKRAAAECDDDLKLAIAKSVQEILQVFGLALYYEK